MRDSPAEGREWITGRVDRFIRDLGFTAPELYMMRGQALLGWLTAAGLNERRCALRIAEFFERLRGVQTPEEHERVKVALIDDLYKIAGEEYGWTSETH